MTVMKVSDDPPGLRVTSVSRNTSELSGESLGYCRGLRASLRGSVERGECNWLIWRGAGILAGQRAEQAPETFRIGVRGYGENFCSPLRTSCLPGKVGDLLVESCDVWVCRVRLSQSVSLPYHGDSFRAECWVEVLDEARWDGLLSCVSNDPVENCDGAGGRRGGHLAGEPLLGQPREERPVGLFEIGVGFVKSGRRFTVSE